MQEGKCEWEGQLKAPDACWEIMVPVWEKNSEPEIETNVGTICADVTTKALTLNEPQLLCVARVTKSNGTFRIIYLV